MFRFNLISFLIGCLVGSAGITFMINILNYFLSLVK